MSIYTRTGDKGKTSLFSGQRVSKADLRVETYGAIDELNSVIGVVLSSKYKVLSIERELIKIQKDLFEIGSQLANPSAEKVQGLGKRVKEFEKMIDEMTEKLPPLQNFILPGGGGTGSALHFARTACRRAERRVVALSEKEKVSLDIIVYLNRLSDLLFTMARFVNHKEKHREIFWPA
ncbi:MAG: cob(I)yrinic acid a,c-diamide adenosyltransferase [Candidatus Levybacteria bacterium]|nr:cob(I)yrinic acid a,c-diamide adenosyltransferase [Candidatus Levybacteria bacterium]MBI2190257.1 cob(I)yrinic acid a,c-diamide adenosyltransferase [Candidatus Levybacteria bacterium]MBI3070333.1 cob(I)yrinic acid a,c-diamide adenosyltransferase [Candidatus Levybacteria bacterium]MBI3092801.1 cob(I)yrinic acid a,c-diamide adenosyltransferase [Candidatus Levybacteria bacterium]